MNSVLETVCFICNSIRIRAKQSIGFQKILTIVRQEFKANGLQIKFKSVRKSFLNQEEFYVNAYYDCEDDYDGEIPIEVIIYHNFDKTIIWDQKHITDLLRELFDAVVHEYKHQRQAKRRSYKTYWTRHDGNHHYHLYLTDPDEIDAYAVSIAIELCRALGKYRALRYMPKLTTLARFKVNGQFVSPNLHAYVSHFSLSDPILKTIAKKIYIRLQKVDTDYIFM
jgi:hypothetical protein